MTDDLVKRLRGGLPCGDVKCFERSAVGGCTCGEAADRIEKLEAALREIADSANWGNDGCWNAESYPDEIARKALEGKDD